MSHPMNPMLDKAGSVMEDAETILGSAATAAAKRYDEARNALESVLERGKDLYGSARKQAIRQTKAADEVLHDHLYNTVLIGIGLGAVLGFLAARHFGQRPD